MLSIVIPIYKEKVNKDEIEKIFADLGYETEVVISVDEYPHKGKGSAIKKGIRFSKGDYILIMDADIQVPCEEIRVFFKRMEIYNADAVIGNKHHAYSNIRYTPWRKITSITYRLFIKTLFHLPFRDTQCGFKLFKSEPLKLILDKLLTDRFSTDVEIIIALIENGFRVIEAPVYVRKQVNRGSVSFKNIRSMVLDTLKIWFMERGGWYFR